MFRRQPRYKIIAIKPASATARKNGRWAFSQVNDSIISSQGTVLQSRVLTLNRFYIAVHVVSARRAFCLLWKDRAEVIHVENQSYMSYDFATWREISDLKGALDERHLSDDWVRAVNFEVQVPRIIRLVSYDRIPKNDVRFNRRNIFLRDENRCQYCSRKHSVHNLSLDHVMPRSRGGESTWENIVCSCLRCNVRKGGRTPQEAGMKLVRAPKRPRHNPTLSLQLKSKKFACWKKFLQEPAT